MHYFKIQKASVLGSEGGNKHFVSKLRAVVEYDIYWLLTLIYEKYGAWLKMWQKCL